MNTTLLLIGDLLLLLALVWVIFKQAIPRFKVFLQKPNKEQMAIFLKGWVLPAGIALAIFGVLFFFYHGTPVETAIRHAFSNEPDLPYHAPVEWDVK